MEMVQPKGHQDRLRYRSCRAATGRHSKNGALLKQSYTRWAFTGFHMSWRSDFSAELHFAQLFPENDTFCRKCVASLLANDPHGYLSFKEKGIIVGSSSRVQAAEVWVLASVWQCALTVSQTFQAQPAPHVQPCWHSRFVSSALCVPCIFQSGRKRWSDWRFQCQLSSGLSEVLCQIPLPAGLSGSKKINPTGEGLMVVGTFFFFFSVYSATVFHQRHCVMPAQW